MRRVLAATLLILLSTALHAAAAGKPLTFEDLRRVVTVRSPAISPDGTQVAYIRSRVNWKADRNDSELVLIRVSDDSSRVLTHERVDVSNPQWSPDGTRIAYMARPALKRPAQIYVLPMNGGDSLRITNASQGVLEYSWRPDSNAIVYTTEDPPPKKANKNLDAVVVTDQDYLTEMPSQPAHLWLVDSDGRKATRLTSGAWSVVKDSRPQIAPDGSVFYQRQPDAVFAHFVSQTTYVYSFTTKTSTNLGLGVDTQPKFCGTGMYGPPDPWYAAYFLTLKPRHSSPYLQQDAFVYRGGRQYEGFGNYTYSFHNPGQFANIPGNYIDPVDRNVHWYGCTLIAQDFLATTNGVRSVLWARLYPGNNEMHQVQLGEVDFSSDATANERGIAFVGLRRDRPAEIYYLSPPSFSTPKQLSNENFWISDYAVPRSEAFEWTTDLGTKAVGVLTYPVNYVAGKKYPLILDIHGGPVSTSTWDMSGLEALSLVPVLASRGYFVFRPNYRGSDNLGDAFLQAIVGDVTSGPGRDNLAAVDALLKTGMIDEKRIGVSGWSGGGLQTSWLIGHANFWRAAVMGAAVTDWYQQATLADINENFAETFFNGITPYSKEGRAKYDAESPLTYAQNVPKNLPVLILSDTRDQRVPVSQAYMFYRALRDRGDNVQFEAFPRYGHFPTDPVGREQVLRAWAGWFDRWMK